MSLAKGVDEWVYFFKNSEIKDDFHSKNIQQARVKLDVLKMSEDDRRAYEEFLAARAAQEDILQTAHATGKAEGKTEGMVEGKAEGEREKALQIARSMLREGLSPALISKMTGLSEAEVEALIETGNG